MGHQTASMSMVYARIGGEAVLEVYKKVLEAGATIAGPLAEMLRSGDLPTADVERPKRHFF